MTAILPAAINVGVIQNGMISCMHVFSETALAGSRSLCEMAWRAIQLWEGEENPGTISPDQLVRVENCGHQQSQTTAAKVVFIL